MTAAEEAPPAPLTQISPPLEQTLLAPVTAAEIALLIVPLAQLSPQLKPTAPTPVMVVAAEKPSIRTGTQWLVVGGDDKGGILLRKGVDLSSQEDPCRLSRGAVVEQVELKGNRLHYQLLQGIRPKFGWVSIAIKGKKLVRELVDVERVVAALHVGSTDGYNRLARLLGMVLTAHSADQALPQLLERLHQQGGTFDPEHSRVFPAHPSGDVVIYGFRGGQEYYRPVGWLRYSFHVESFDLFKQWCVAYHGTKHSNVVSILLRGLKRPGEDGVIEMHGHVASNFGRTIYVSPSFEYAAHPVYAQFFRLDKDHWAQLVLQFRVRPEGIRQIASTLWDKHWPQNVRMDPNFANMNGLEWLVKDPSDVIVYGLMVREFGSAVDESIYGSTACQVRECGPAVSSWPFGTGPEYEWMRLRSKEFMQRGLFIK